MQIKEEIAKANSVSGVHSRILLEDGHFYLEDAGSKFGTFIGFPKKRFVQLAGGDQLMLGTARCRIEHYLGKFQLIDGLIDKIMGNLGTNVHDLKVLPTNSSTADNNNDDDPKPSPRTRPKSPELIFFLRTLAWCHVAGALHLLEL